MLLDDNGVTFKYCQSEERLSDEVAYMKRAEGLSMGLIIVAAIALLVLVILSVLVLRAGGQIGIGTACLGIDGAYCEEDDGGPDVCPENYIRDNSKPCRNEGEVCCIPGPLR